MKTVSSRDNKLQAALDRALQRREKHLRALLRNEDTISDLRIRLKRRSKTKIVQGPDPTKWPPNVPLPWEKEEPSSPPVAVEIEGPAIPEFLRRGQAAQAAVDECIDEHEKQRIKERDAARAAEVKAADEAARKERARKRKEAKDIVPPSKFKDEKAKQMPLTGRDALRFIKEKKS